MKLTWQPYTLEFKHPFRIAHGVRNTTPVVFTRIEQDGFTGYGEASMPPYLGESHDSVLAFLKQVQLESINGLFDPDEVMQTVDAIAEGNAAAKASVDIALHDLLGKMKGKPLYELFGADPASAPCTSFTIGMDDTEMILQKVEEAQGYPILKVKLGGGDDIHILETIRSVTDKPLSVDANQGWNNKEEALEMIYRMKDMQVTFVEQPFSKNRFGDHAWLTERSPLPVIADESCQRLSDIARCAGSFHGINIKLMKCTGLSEARKMIGEAQKRNLKILIGCMSETSCAVSAAAALTPFANWADLDGPLLIKNNVFNGVDLDKGKIRLSALPGTGAVLNSPVFGT
ncbi:MAG TPA: dipeptide epimerase [Bacteroidia bacterium]|jgi:L-alanine-DL-glutamate epimerase-like enolase superfamily enzyme|nr:dipeptide epimerase [Bacteroidia bacterium]